MSEKILLSEKFIDIRWTDMDSHKHVNNCNYFHYMTEIRHDLLLKPFLPKPEVYFFVINISCNFKRPLAYPGQVLLKQYITGLGKTSLSLLFEFYDNENNLTTLGHATLVSVDVKTNKPVAIPENILTSLPTIQQKPEKKELALPENASVLSSKHIPLRWTDNDAFDHLSNAQYFDFFGEARLSALPKDIIKELPCYFFLVDTQSDFLKPIIYPGNVVVDVGILEFRKTSFSMFGKFKLDGDETIYAKAIASIVCVDKKTLKPVPVPQILIDRLS